MCGSTMDGLTRGIAFEKYSLLGNTFLLVDETHRPLRDDLERAAFARWALDGYFGLGGADNVLYTAQLTGASEGPYSFRIFEHDGTETLSCGNGLLSMAAALHHRSAATRWQVSTELPSGRPHQVHIGVHGAGAGTWVEVGQPRAVPGHLFRRPRPTTPTAPTGIDAIDEIKLEFPEGPGWARGLPATVSMSGWLVFVGEPHLVVVLGHGLPAELAGRLFPPPPPEGSPAGDSLPALLASNALVEHLGACVNAQYKHWFPAGVHVNVVLIRDRAGPVDYRTWERAIDRETLACGTGALACAHVARTLGLIDAGGSTIVLRPHRCRWHRPDAALRVTTSAQGLTLSGRPSLICQGSVPAGAWPRR
jgi:diaminopimelate epimerase